MRNLRNSRGWMRLVGLILTSVLIFVFIFYIQDFQMDESDQRSNWDVVMLTSYAWDALRTLDLRDECCYAETSDLRDYVYDGNWSAIGNEVENYLPLNVGYSLYLYMYNGTLIHKAGINDSGLPVFKNRVVVDYVIAGDYGYGCDSTNGEPCSLYLMVWFIQ